MVLALVILGIVVLILVVSLYMLADKLSELVTRVEELEEGLEKNTSWKSNW